jgi:hypothetical protein
MKKRGAVALQLDVANQRITKFKVLRDRMDPKVFENRIAKLLKKSKSLDEALAKHDESLDKWEADNKGKGLKAVTAFITFEEEEGINTR